MTILLSRVLYFDEPVTRLHRVVYHRVSRRGSRLRYTRINTVHGGMVYIYTYLYRSSVIIVLYYSSGIEICYRRYGELR